jgi:hypothetical protein
MTRVNALLEAVRGTRVAGVVIRVGVEAPKLGRVSRVARWVGRVAELASEAARAEGASLPFHRRPYHDLRQGDRSFEPVRPVLPAYTRQPFGIAAPQPIITDPLTHRVAEVAVMAYELVLPLLNRFFTHTDETEQQLSTLIGAAISMMGGVLRPLATTLPTLPAGPPHQGRTAGFAFEV